MSDRNTSDKQQKKCQIHSVLTEIVTMNTKLYRRIWNNNASMKGAILRDSDQEQFEAQQTEFLNMHVLGLGNYLSRNRI